MYTVQLQLPAAMAASVSDLLELGEHSIVQREDFETGETWLELFLGSREEAEEEAKNLVQILEMFGCEGLGVPRVTESADRDWQEAWKEHFHCMKVSRRVTVCPSWEAVEEARDEIVVRLDPGMSFGTGQHPTTQACLAFMDDLMADGKPRSLCDVGCGSGILSIAGARLGCAPVLAFDHDPVSVRTAEENLAANDVRTVEVRRVDLGRCGSEHLAVADLVVANILSHLLEEHAAAIFARLAPGPEARLILAGMAGQEQYAWTRLVYERLGLRELEMREDGEWVSLMMSRRV